MTIKAVIWDMDGLLIDSEPLWQVAEVAAFAQVGLHLQPEETNQTMGLRIDAAVEYWYRKQPWEGLSLPEVEKLITDKFVALVKESGEPLPGVMQALDFCQAKGVQMAIASSSYMPLIESVVERLQIASYFEAFYSAGNEEYGKPHPAVFLTAANGLGVDRLDCLVLEDSLRGVIAAKAAEMMCVAVPDEFHKDDIRYNLADVILPSLEKFDEEIWQKLHYNRR